MSHTIKSPQLDEFLRIAEDAVTLGEGLFFDLDRRLRVVQKGERDFATHVDLEIESEIKTFLSKATTKLAFLSEEKDNTRNSAGPTWALDPIDGTVNFWHSHPLCGISLALVENDSAVVAVVSFPFLKTRYYAMKGRGAFRNGTPIAVSSVSSIEESVVAMGDFSVGEGAWEKNQDRFAVIRALGSRCLRIRMHGSAAADLCFVADGKLDASVTLSNSPWDVQAGVLIAREAGAIVSDLAGKPHTITSSQTICSNGQNTEVLLKRLNDAIA